MYEVTWEELVEEFQKIPEEMLLEEVECEARKFSPDVFPEATELILRLRRIELKLKDIKAFPYKNILEKNSISAISRSYPDCIRLPVEETRRTKWTGRAASWNPVFKNLCPR